ncbi:DUF2179 domain-containing protein [candidate division KSB1 bacterium]|nr:DUF2179 domain-containing protein [candidate division KSB1 bacterium]NIR70993.1 DUF2179 domain-containing protein [candidate division KSB1 bacterium]NIS24734.1 DUF2179 domain-containing protein [candidate division KSB1 bacterium]NIT71638.1 DUF2179 domain-containing protein [candidate division KSB1 bacterium]NIU25345.1 DUF2179 domain-containing protein [candidate division KSB1 bacterium]
MIDGSFFESEVYLWLVLPVLIFLARICDVTIGTLRIIFTTRGYKRMAASLGFFEISIWLLAISAVFKNLNNVGCFLGYAAGYTAGIYLGMYVENKMAIGIQIVRIVTRSDASQLISHLRSEGYGITTVDGQGSFGPVKIIFSLIKRKDLPNIIKSINYYNPKALFSVEDVRLAERAVVRKTPSIFEKRFLNRFKLERKGK